MTPWRCAKRKRPKRERGSAQPQLRSGPEATLMSTWNFQIFPILCNATACNGDAFLFQHLGNLFVGQRASRIFVLDVFFHLTFDNQQRCSVPYQTMHCLREKEPQLEYTLRRVREFVGDSPADSRRMYPNFLSNVFDHHWLQIIDALVEKFRLAPDNRFTNLDDNMLALLNILQKLHCRFKT